MTTSLNCDTLALERHARATDKPKYLHKPMHSKTQQLNSHVFPYILSCIDADGYDVQPETDAEKLQFLSDTFHAEYGWMIDRVGPVAAFSEWLKGLPSSVNIEFTNWDILRLAREWGSLPENATERQEQKILDNYWNLIANKTFQLFRKYEVR